jgi:pyroglutamyl-peptidase
MANPAAKKFKVVVTGFGPFRQVKENESWLAVSGLWSQDLPDYIKLVTRELPVIYEVAKREVDKLWDEEKPDLMIHVGVSVEDTQISVEKCSFNMDYVSGDNLMVCPANGVCVPNAPEILQTKLDVDKLVHISNHTFRTTDSKAKCGPSNDPGRFLCGYTYFVSLFHDENKSLFVHVPSRETCKIEEMTLALRSIIIESLSQLYGEQISSMGLN